ncbi:MAG: dihydrodipicolinate synthase family protein [Pseudomonas sp.]|uniref:dihydrodipicolinate synthase family protein n=1 Tax=Pseudomonas sp. TaxID=306 RepID=UPI00299E30DA|nr:dihydrodipicolinate synthase family protein [Pseudomonas sp.]MDX1723535.1 dihydrodipicolinate synthase family protein [Pseudomonas sp.]
MIRGSIAALVTPMSHTGQVDYDSLERLVAFRLGESTDALVVASRCAAALSGDEDSARGLDARLQALNAALFIEPNPVPVKWALQQMSLIAKGIRWPMTWLSPRHEESLRAALQARLAAPAS